MSINTNMHNIDLVRHEIGIESRELCEEKIAQRNGWRRSILKS